jgi:hypothetical protein
MADVLAGTQPITTGCSKILFIPRSGLSKDETVTLALGSDNLATVSWETSADGKTHVELVLKELIEGGSFRPQGIRQQHG